MRLVFSDGHACTHSARFPRLRRGIDEKKGRHIAVMCEKSVVVRFLVYVAFRVVEMLARDHTLHAVTNAYTLPA